MDASLLLGWPARAGSVPKSKALRIGRSHISGARLFKGEGHCLTVAPTGAGKGVSSIIPNLLLYPGPAIVVDPKGENCIVTARRRAEMGQEIVLLDPFHRVDPLPKGVRRGSLNPFDFISDEEDQAEEQSHMIAEILGGTSSSQDPYWDQSARALLAALVFYVARANGLSSEDRNFSSLVDTAFDSLAFSLAMSSDGQYVLREGRFSFSPLSPFSKSPLPPFSRRIIEEMALLPQTTRQCIINFAQSYLRVLTGKTVLETLLRSTVSVEDITEGKALTIYIVIPPDKLASHRDLLRIWIAMLLSAIMSRRGSPDERTLFLLDECAQLGSLNLLVSAVTLLRGYGLQVWMFFQDLSQVQALYGKNATTLINNCSVFQAFGYTRRGSMDPVLDIVGDVSREELYAIGGRKQLLSVSGERKTQFLERAFYYSDPLFKGMFDLNPLVGQ